MSIEIQKLIYNNTYVSLDGHINDEDDSEIIDFIADTFDIEAFKREYPKMVQFFNKSNAKLIITSSFWKHPGDGEIENYAKSIGADFIYLGELGEDAEMRADGLFKSSGVSMHPGDKGMETIAYLIFEKMRRYL